MEAVGEHPAKHRGGLTGDGREYRHPHGAVLVARLALVQQDRAKRVVLQHSMLTATILVCSLLVCSLLVCFYF